MISLMAYVDPASTAIIWQILVGVLITFSVVLGIWWTKITTFIKTVWVKLFNKNKGEEQKSKDADAASEIDEELADEVK